MPVFVTNNPTLSELRDRVANRGYDVTTALADDAINSALEDVYAARRWPFLDTLSQSVTLPASASSVTLGVTDLLHVNSVRLADMTLNWVDANEVENFLRCAPTVTDVPGLWSRRGVDLIFYPHADADYVLDITYAAEPPKLVADDDQTVVPRTYIAAVVWGAVAVVAFRQRDYVGADRAEKKRDDALRTMAQQYGLKQRQGGRRVIETGFWDDMA